MPARFGPLTPAAHPAVRYGLRLCDGGFYWESHEVLEAAWLASALNGRDRLALRGLIQLANAGLKLRMGRGRAARRLLGEVRACLTETRPGTDAGIASALNRSALLAALDDLEAALASGGEPPPLPRLTDET